MYSSVLLHSLCCAVITISITFLSPQTETLYQPLSSPFSHLQPLVTSNHLHVYEVKVKVKVTQSCPTLCDPMDYAVHGILQARILEWVAFPFSRGSSQPGIEPRSPILQADSLPAEPQGKPKNTGVGSPSLHQRIFLTQESNWGLLRCRRILYQLSHEGSPCL